MMSALLILVLFLVLVGVGLWALGQFPAIDPTIKKVIKVLVVVIVVVVVVLFLFHYVLGVDLPGGRGGLLR
jgi:hypothetical protein